MKHQTLSKHRKLNHRGSEPALLNVKLYVT